MVVDINLALAMTRNIITHNSHSLGSFLQD